MKRLIAAVTLTTLISAAGAQTVTVPSLPQLHNVQLGLTAGYASGLSGEVFVLAPNLAGPLGVKLSAAYTSPSDNIRDDVSIDPTLGLETFGKAKTTLGASESGSHLTFGLDGTYSLGEITPGVTALAYAGGRYGMFKATESYALSNTSTTYSMNSFGIGAGAQLSYALAGNTSLVGDIGVDQYFNSTINVSNGDSIATDEANYAALRNRFAFPGTVFKAKIGVKFGGY